MNQEQELREPREHGSLPALGQEKAQKPPTGLVVVDNGEFANFLDTARFNQMWRVAGMFANSAMIPDRFKGDQGSCFIAFDTAVRLGVHPLAFMQKSYVVHGSPGIESQLVIALVNTRGPFTGPIQWRFEGDRDSLKCTAYATHKKTGEVCEMTIGWDTVVGEGWNKNPKWVTMKHQMFRYRTAAWLARAYCPEVTLGLYTVDELHDVQTAAIDVTPREDPAPFGSSHPRNDDCESLLGYLLAGEDEDRESVTEFVSQSAKYNNCSKTEVIESALASSADFWEAYRVWLGKHNPGFSKQEKSENGERKSSAKPSSPKKASPKKGAPESEPKQDITKKKEPRLANDLVVDELSDLMEKVDASKALQSDLDTITKAVAAYQGGLTVAMAEQIKSELTEKPMANLATVIKALNTYCGAK